MTVMKYVDINQSGELTRIPVAPGGRLNRAGVTACDVEVLQT